MKDVTALPGIRFSDEQEREIIRRFEAGDKVTAQRMILNGISEWEQEMARKHGFEVRR